MLALALPALLLAAVPVEGVTTCPRPDQVAAHLGELLSADVAPAGQPRRDGAARARLSEEAGDLVVVLLSPADDVIGARRFPRSYACEDLAAAVAVSIAVWMSDVHPSYTSTYPAATGPEPRAPSADVRLVAPPPTAPAATWGVGLALGLGGSIDGPRAAADALAGGWVRLARSRTALRAELEAQSRRQVTLQTGHGEWRRWALGIGIERTLSAGDDGSGWLRGFATARLAVLQLEGVGFAVNHSSQAVDPGAAAGLRAVWRRGSWASWIEAALSLWPVGHEAVAADEAQRLPVFEGFLRVGAGWGAAR